MGDAKPPDGSAIETLSEARESGKEATGVQLSIIVLLEESSKSAEEMWREYTPALDEMGRAFEFVFVAGPRQAGRVPPIVGPRHTRNGTMRVLQVGQPVGQSSLLKIAAEHCRAGTIVTLPPSFRVAPEAIPELIRKVDSGFDVAVARRCPRRASLFNRFQSWFCTWMLNLLTGSRFHDATCRVSAMRRSVLEEIPLYGSYFRFLPVVAMREGFRVEEVPVRQHPGGEATRVYRPGVYLGWLIDIFGIFFLLSFTYRPLRFFGSVGAVFGTAGGVVLVVLLVQRLGGQGIADRPLLLLGVLLLTLGVQAVALGLIGEIVVHFQASQGATYRLARSEHTRER